MVEKDPMPPDDALRAELQALLSARRHEWPRRAFQRVVLGLRSTSRQTRALALRLAPRDVYDSIARELLALLDHRAEDDGERLQVIAAIGGMVARAAAFGFDVPCNPGAATKVRFETLVTRLRQLFYDPDAAMPLRLSALEVGARAGTSWAAGAARVAWRTDEPAWRRGAARAFAWLEGFEEEIGETVDDPDPLVRIAGWRAAAEQHVEGLAGVSLQRALNTGLQGEERAAALTAVGVLAPAGAADALREQRFTFTEGPLAEAHEDAMAQLELSL